MTTNELQTALLEAIANGQNPFVGLSLDETKTLRTASVDAYKNHSDREVPKTQSKAKGRLNVVARDIMDELMSLGKAFGTITSFHSEGKINFKSLCEDQRLFNQTQLNWVFSGKDGLFKVRRNMTKAELTRKALNKDGTPKLKGGEEYRENKPSFKPKTLLKAIVRISQMEPTKFSDMVKAYNHDAEKAAKKKAAKKEIAK